MNSMNFIDKYILLVYCIVEIYLVYTFFECFFEKKSWALEPKKLYLTNAVQPVCGESGGETGTEPCHVHSHKLCLCDGFI